MKDFFNMKRIAGDVNKPQSETSNPARRTFLKLLGIGGAAVVLNIVTDKVSGVMSSASLDTNSFATSKRTKIGTELSYSENKRETVIYDASGEEVLIFEKTV